MTEVTVEAADTYMLTRLGASELWKAGTAKEAALATAANDLQQSGEFTLDGVPQEAWTGAVCEQALFLLAFGQGLDTRMGLIAQGVTQAGVVDEAYNQIVAHVKHGGKFPIAPRARQWLHGFEAQHGNTEFIGTLTRE